MGLIAVLTLVPAAVSRPDSRPGLFEELAARSFPPHYDRVTLFNPWGEDLFVHVELPEDFGDWVVAAARVYAEQKIRFDGYMGSTDDGRHYRAAADGVDKAFYGDAQRVSYREVRNGEIDDLSERTWICLDLPIHAITLAGYPLRPAIANDYYEAREIYTLGGTFPEN